MPRGKKKSSESKVLPVARDLASLSTSERDPALELPPECEVFEYEHVVMVTLCLLFEGMTDDGCPILRDKLKDKLFVLKPYKKEEKDAARQEEVE